MIININPIFLRPHTLADSRARHRAVCKRLPLPQTIYNFASVWHYCGLGIGLSLDLGLTPGLGIKSDQVCLIVVSASVLVSTSILKYFAIISHALTALGPSSKITYNLYTILEPYALFCKHLYTNGVRTK